MGEQALLALRINDNDVTRSMRLALEVSNTPSDDYADPSPRAP